MIEKYEGIEKLQNNVIIKKDDIVFSFAYGAKAEIRGSSDNKYLIRFYNGENLEYQTEIGTGFFASPNKKYFTNWKLQAYHNGELIKEELLSLENKRVLVEINSSSLGDTLAWVPQAVQFSKKHSCKLVLSTFYNEIFDYPDVEFVSPGAKVECYAAYSIGYFIYESQIGTSTPVDPRTTSLGKVAADILSIDYEEIRPSLKIADKQKTEKYVCISTMSTAGAKLWHRKNGWQDIIDYLSYRGYKVAVIQKETHDFKNVIDLSGNRSLEERISQLNGSEFFIGLGSGLSWLAWAVNKPVIMISGFSKPFAEFSYDNYRVINETVCNGCWNDTSHEFDKGNWNWCPLHENTERQFECTHSITAVLVIKEIDKIILSKEIS